MRRRAGSGLLCLLSIAASCGPLGREPLGSGRFEIARGGIKHFPFAFDLGEDGGAALVSYSEHPDDYIEDPTDAVAKVVAGGMVVAAVQAPNFYISGMAAIGGAIYAASYITKAVDEKTEAVHGWLSEDGGKSWKPQPGRLQLPEAPKTRPAGWGGLLIHRRLHARGSSIAGTMYGNYEGDGNWYRTVWAQSDDWGLTWNVVATVAAGPRGTEGYGEPVSALCSDGRILVVMRTGPQSPLAMSRSADGGKSWEKPADLAGMMGWDPDLVQVPGGILLSYGITGRLWLASSADCGDSWSQAEVADVGSTSGYSGLIMLGGLPVLVTDAEKETAILGIPITPPLAIRRTRGRRVPGR